MEYEKITSATDEEIESLCRSGRLYQRWEAIQFTDEGKTVKVDKFDKFDQIRDYEQRANWFFAFKSSMQVIRELIEAGNLYKSVEASDR